MAESPSKAIKQNMAGREKVQQSMPCKWTVPGAGVCGRYHARVRLSVARLSQTINTLHKKAQTNEARPVTQE
ncbi:hypothetical protein OS493_000924 [Desmophyllum pertusum]|uniref:Uncharacterized protein n=1 Tax=Desmophyllum pertusum TaxID=174260 RepID=A0A9W9ZU98_9CNID|nr:hypothetical protein OS493_000924 [Desmophyllum pertusum]